jgi:hypothetical protein
MSHHPLKTKSNKFITTGLIAVFILPLIAAHVLYALRDHLAFKTIQTGQLLSPPFKAKNLPFFSHTFLGKWQLIYIHTTKCNATCTATLSALEKIHFALGKEKHRVEYREIIQAHSIPILTIGEIAIIDPQGWIIMRYAANADLKGLLRDLRQLLRVSHVG